MAANNNINTKSQREISLEKQLNTLCTNENCNKIKELLNGILILSCVLEKSLNQYITEKANNNQDINDETNSNIENVILNSIEVQRSFLNVIYFESFNELANAKCNYEQVTVSKSEIINRILSYIDILSRLYILIDNNLHSKYIVEILFSINKVLTLFMVL